MKKLVTALLCVLALMAVALAAAFTAFAVITKDAKLDGNKLTDYSRVIEVCDENRNQLTDASIEARRGSVSIKQLPKHTSEAFIASEDRNFFSHHGLDYPRMAKALMKDITTRSFSQGASTISQQLVKNTHLTGDKTIKRKLTEIKLTRQLESRYSKQQILEMYLNTIYFGHNCYGLASAARYYFGVPAEKLTLSQSATLAGIIASPNNYSPFNDIEKCTKRRNIVLKAMLDCNFIDNKTYENTKKMPIETHEKSTLSGINAYVSCVFDELEGLNLRRYTLLEGCKVVTYMNTELQKTLDEMTPESDFAAIVTNQLGGVTAYRSDIGAAARQPGSTIKPLLVYAPAIEEKLICPATKIADERIDIGGYSPENYDKKYHGYVSATEALAKSYNIPAVKTLNSLTIEKAQKYAERLGIKLEKSDKNLALALGGMSRGLTLEELTEKYSAFANGGTYSPTKFIKEIKDSSGKSVYSARQRGITAFSTGTASLINGMLKTAVTNGTAAKLNTHNYDIAAKTGTCGNREGNTDCYCIAYTSENCVGVWLGSKHNERLKVNGGNCCEVANTIFDKLYAANLPAPLETAKGTREIDIDREEYNQKNKITQADEIAPALAKIRIRIPAQNFYVERSNKFSCPEIKKPQISVKNNTVFIELYHTQYYAYTVKREISGKTDVIYDGPWKNEITDKPNSERATYTVTPYYFDGKERHSGREIILPEINICGSQSPQISPPVIDEWLLG